MTLKFKVLKFEKYKLFLSCKFFQFWVIKTPDLDPDPYPDPH